MPSSLSSSSSELLLGLCGGGGDGEGGEGLGGGGDGDGGEGDGGDGDGGEGEAARATAALPKKFGGGEKQGTARAALSAWRG